MADRNGQQLVKLVNSLLDFPRIDATRAQAVYEPCDLGALTAEIVSTFRPVIEHAGLRLRVDCPPSRCPGYVDRDLWEMILLNLLSNAFKFTFEGEIAVTLTSGADRMVLTAADTGTGIPPEHLAHVFERFHRVPEARSRSHEGTGIGLALVQELARLHGGSVAVASEVDRGTTFTVTIPTGTAHLPADRVGAVRTPARTGAASSVDEAAGWLPDGVDAGADVPVAERTAPAGGRIVLADGNTDMREYLSRLLGRTYDVRPVADGAAALAAVRADPPDLVVADVTMPRLDGFGLLRALRADTHTRTLPVILLSARAGEEAYVEGLTAGATDYVVKPFSARELLARVSRRLEIARLNRHAVDRQQQMRKAILDGMADRYYAVDAAWRYTGFNAEAEAQLRLLGKDPAALIGKVLWDEFPDPPDEKALRDAMRERRPTTYVHYYEALREWVENRIRPAEDGGIAIFQRYVTESKRLEGQLRRTAAYLADAETLSRTGSWAWNPSSGQLFWSAELFRIFALEPDSVTPTYDLALAGIHPEDRPLLEAAFSRAVAERRPYALECRLLRPGGEIRYIRTLARPVPSETGQLVEYVGSVIDMTERVHADDALRRSQQELAHLTRVLSLGALTASIGHDLSQFVVAIETNGSACLRWLSRERPDLDQAAAAVRRIMRDAGAVGDVIANIRAFLRKTAGTKTEVSLADLLCETRRLVEAEAAKQHVVIEASMAAALPSVLAVRVELQQVLLNLMLNGIEAMAGVAARPRILRIHCEPDDLEHGPGVVVAVEDCGPGLMAVDPARLFDAFYTTKPQGLGMGLSIARSIVEGHGGRLEVTANAEHGLTFRFTIPTARAA